jgi:hypothetical protein
MTNKSLKPDEERAKFEAWFKLKFHLAEEHLKEGDYGSDTAQTAWIAWSARAQLEESCPTTRS